MTIARREQIRLDLTPYYHCITRCVRRAFLCGYDKKSGNDFEHRKGWIEKRLLLLTRVFCIEIAGYAVMSNHYHVILKVDSTLASSLSNDQVIARWRLIYKGPMVVQRYLDGEDLDEVELNSLEETVAQWRDNLSNISRFMGNLNESIARKANKEDDCTGRFWESRFKAQAILDLPALLRTMCYVDLNPVRARVTKTPEQSRFTSINRRLQFSNSGLMEFKPVETAVTQKNSRMHSHGFSSENIPIGFNDYLEILDWTGRQILQTKKGRISSNAPDIMSRLGFTPTGWMKTQKPNVSWMQRAVGRTEEIKEYCSAIGQRWIWQTA